MPNANYTINGDGRVSLGFKTAFPGISRIGIDPAVVLLFVWSCNTMQRF